MSGAEEGTAASFATVPEFMPSLAEALPGVWTPGEECYDHLGVVEGACGERIKVVRYGNQPDRLEIFGTYPTGEHDPLTIRVTVRKTAAKVAKDIARRLLPEYLPRLERERQRLQERDLCKQECRSALEGVRQVAEIKDRYGVASEFGEAMLGLRHEGGTHAFARAEKGPEDGEVVLKLEFHGLKQANAEHLMEMWIASVTADTDEVGTPRFPWEWSWCEDPEEHGPHYWAPAASRLACAGTDANRDPVRSPAHEPEVDLDRRLDSSSDPVLGQRIVKLRSLDEAECRAQAWYLARYERVAVLVLENGTKLYPSCDPEGNGPGALFGATRDGTPLVVY